jgi:GT2 family glycosyltransferase
MVDLSILLVNWNCLVFTEQCIASIVETTHGISYEVIVVDNDSADAPCQRLLDAFPSIKLVLSTKNLGFGLANNLGVLHANGRTLLFLNPDTVILGDAVHRMLLALGSMKDGGAVGCRLLNPDGSLQTSCVMACPTITNQLLALRWLQTRWPSLPLWGKQALYSTSQHIVHEVEAVSGAAIMVKRDVFDEVGGFSPEYFMFAEEVDLCVAIQNAGYRIGHVGEARIIHFGGQSTSQCEDGFAAVRMRDSVYRFFRRHRGSPYALMYRGSLLLSAFFRIAILICVFPISAFSKSPDRKITIITALRKWRLIARWSVGIPTQPRGMKNSSSVYATTSDT